MKNLNDAIVERINQLSGNNLTQYELSKRSGIPYPTIKSIMQKRTKGIDFRTVILLAKGFDMTLTQFLDSPLFSADNLDLE